VVKQKKFEDDTIKLWPEILKDIEIESIPSDYVVQIKVNFTDGREWIIDMSDNEIPDVNKVIEDLQSEYGKVISSINFNVDIDKIKKDIEKRTTVFLKKRK
jgi:hypothetical protein